MFAVSLALGTVLFVRNEESRWDHNRRTLAAVVESSELWTEV